jgi:hypothetical protein
MKDINWEVIPCLDKIDDYLQTHYIKIDCICGAKAGEACAGIGDAVHKYRAINSPKQFKIENYYEIYIEIPRVTKCGAEITGLNGTEMRCPNEGACGAKNCWVYKITLHEI